MLLVALSWPAWSADPVPGDPVTERERTSYSLGMQLGDSLRNADPTLVLDQLMDGLRAAFNGAQTKITREEASGILEEAERSARGRLAGNNLERANNFLSKNGMREAVRSTASGLQYEVLRKGEGAMPQDKSRVRVHYRGTLINGAEFDSSYNRGTPATFGVNQVISGWTEALKMMPVGSKWKLFIPPALAYGERGAGRMIGPNEALIFEVELLEIVE